MESFEDRKCLHDKNVRYKAVCRVSVEFFLPVSGEFNPNYKDGIDVAEDQASDIAWDSIPDKWRDVEVSVRCQEIEEEDAN